MRKILAISLALLLMLPVMALAEDAAPGETPESLSPATLLLPAEWRVAVEEALLAASFAENERFLNGDAIGEAAQYRFESKWDDGKLVLWQEVYGADQWAGYGLIFAFRYKDDEELNAFAAHCREATLIALAATHPGLSAEKLAAFLDELCPDYAEVAKAPAYTERAASLGSMTYTVTGGGEWGLPSFQAFHSDNADAYLRELQGTK